MRPIDLIIIGILVGALLSLGAVIIGDFSRNRKTKPAPPHIPLDSICPACGWPGCTLRCIPPGQIEVGEKREVQATPPMVERKCNTCGALAYEKTVLAPERWVKK